MPRPRWEKLAADIRDSILETASSEFAEKGFDKASFNRIIEQAGLSKGAVYYYFDDKEDLFTTVMGRAIKVFRESIGGFEPVNTPDEFWAEFRKYLKRGAAYKMNNPAFVRLGMAMMRAIQNHRTSMPVRLMYRESMSQLTDIFRQGQQIGAVRQDLPPELLVAMVFGASEASQGWVMHLIEEQKDILRHLDLDKTTEYVLGLYRRLLLPGDEPSLSELIATAGDPPSANKEKA